MNFVRLAQNLKISFQKIGEKQNFDFEERVVLKFQNKLAFNVCSFTSVAAAGTGQNKPTKFIRKIGVKLPDYFPRRQKLKAQAQQLRETAVNKRWRLVWRLAKSLCLLTYVACTSCCCNH